jgi:Zn-dependent peptidase ImmA (M78 family)
MPTQRTIRYDFARRKAAELLEEGRVTKAPVPVKRLATLRGAVIRYQPFEEDGQHLSGMVRRLPDGSAVIGVNALHHTKRQRFTIAHELGHLLLHKDESIHVDKQFLVDRSRLLGKRDRVSSQAEDPKEIEANQFAAELLMPRAFLLADLRGRRIDLESGEIAQELAGRYQVSVHAMTIRLARFFSGL